MNTPTLPLATSQSTPRRHRCLALTLCPGQVGLALASVAHVVHTQVVNIRKLRSREAREARVRQVVLRMVEAYRPTHLVLVLSASDDEEPLLTALRTWLEATATEHGLQVLRMTRGEVRQALVPRGTRPSNRNLADLLATRFAAVAELAPSREKPLLPMNLVGAVGMRRRLRTSRERYWQPMFLALGAATTVLDGATPPA